jgi:DNA adenine methylase
MKAVIEIQNGQYFGGKGAAGVVHKIINQIPQHKTFISGFLGKCHVLRYKLPAAKQIGIEIDPETLKDWEGLKFTEQITPHKIAILQGDFMALELPEMLEASTFIYLDPPYLHETRTSQKRYKYEMTESQHFQLLEKIKGLPCMVAISCYDSEIYRKALTGWRIIQFESQTRKGKRLETLYMNYPAPEPESLHDTRYLGNDYRQREKSKRRIKTIFRKIENLTRDEKAAIMDELKKVLDKEKSK